MRILITGGAKNGKSTLAEKYACEMAEETGLPLYYVATMIPYDEEDWARIERHKKEREGKGFTTLEIPRSVGKMISMMDLEEGVYLVDSTTAILANEMFSGTTEDEFDLDAGTRVAEDLRAFAERVENVVFVSDGIYSEAEEHFRTIETYRKALALIDRTLASVADRVIEVSFGIERDWK